MRMIMCTKYLRPVLWYAATRTTKTLPW